MKAVVLAAGKGVRLEPITSTRPKHMIKLAGKPILERCLSGLKACGIKDVVLVVNYMADVIEGYFGDGGRLGIKIEYARQQERLGTGNALITVQSLVQEDFALVYGDLLFSADLMKKVLTKHQDEQPSATMAVVPVEQPENYGIVEVNDHDHVEKIIEKPSREEAPSNLANTGIYVFAKDIIAKAKETLTSTRGEWEIPDAITLMLKESKEVIAVRAPKDDWMDIGRPWDLLEANRWILTRRSHRIMGSVEEGAHLTGPVTVAETARVRSGAYVEGPVYIGADCDVGPNCYLRSYTSLGRKVRIGNACEIKNSIVMDNTHVGHLSYVGDSVIGENCNLAAGTLIGNYRFDATTVKMLVKDTVLDSGRTKLGAILGDGVKTGLNALFMPGTKVGSECWVGPGVIVNRDLPAKTTTMLKQQFETRTRGF
jgi:UDP-N-acetylglucosamine diphosphorylase/glucosamine-1-phosphate N-acetyltransferase